MTGNKEVLECAMRINRYCKEHPNCKGCMFSFSQVCVLKWTKPDQWHESISKVLDRKKVSCYTDKREVKK